VEKGGNSNLGVFDGFGKTVRRKWDRLLPLLTRFGSPEKVIKVPSSQGRTKLTTEKKTSVRRENYI